MLFPFCLLPLSLSRLGNSGELFGDTNYILPPRAINNASPLASGGADVNREHFRFPGSSRSKDNVIRFFRSLLSSVGESIGSSQQCF